MLQTEQSRFTGEVCGSEKPIEANERGELSREYYAREMDTRMYLVRRTFTLEQVFPFFPPLSHFFFWPPFTRFPFLAKKDRDVVCALLIIFFNHMEMTRNR